MHDVHLRGPFAAVGQVILLRLRFRLPLGWWLHVCRGSALQTSVQHKPSLQPRIRKRHVRGLAWLGQLSACSGTAGVRLSERQRRCQRHNRP